MSENRSGSGKAAISASGDAAANAPAGTAAGSAAATAPPAAADTVIVSTLPDSTSLMGKSGYYSWYSVHLSQNPGKKYVKIDLVKLNDVWFSQDSISLDSEKIHNYFQNSKIDCEKIEGTDKYLIKGFFGWEIKSPTPKFVPLYIPTLEVVRFDYPCPHYASLNNRRLYTVFLTCYCKLTNPGKALNTYSQAEIAEIMRTKITGKDYNYKTDNELSIRDRLEKIYIPCVIHEDIYDEKNLLDKRVGEQAVHLYKKTAPAPGARKYHIEPPGSYGNMIAIRAIQQPTFAHTMFFGAPILPSPSGHLGRTRQHVLEPIECQEGNIESVGSYEIKFKTQSSGKTKHTVGDEKEAYEEMNEKFTKIVKDLPSEDENEGHLPGLSGGYKRRTRKHKKYHHHKKRYQKTKKISLLESNVSDIAEIVHKRSNIVFQDAEKAKEYLSRLDADIRLDFHGVLDILGDTEALLPSDRSKYKICVISFVGALGDKRIEVREDLKKRLANKQIDFGVLVFRRGRGRDKHTYVEAGSKAWTNNAIGCNRLDTCLFVDDSTDHLRSTKYLCGDKIETQLFNSGKPAELKALLAKYVATHKD